MTAPKKVAPEVHLVDGKITTDSLSIAKHFGKQHKDILKAIQNLEFPDNFRERNFAPTQRETKMPTGGIRKDTMYHITRDGFAILVMGFTGKKAMEWKITYLEAFNQMEQKLVTKSLSDPQITQKSPKNKKLKSDAPQMPRLSSSQLQKLEAAVAEAATRCNQPDGLVRGLCAVQFNARYLSAIPAWKYAIASNYVNRLHDKSGCFKDRAMFAQQDDAVLDTALEAHDQLGWCIRKLAREAAEGKEARDRLEQMGKLLLGLPVQR